MMHTTPLCVAATENSSRCVEALVGYGADVTLANSNGHTPLHHVLNSMEIKTLSEWTLHLNKVISHTNVLVHYWNSSMQFHECVSSADNRIQSVPVYITVACFLVSEGASLEAKSQEGATPLDLCPPEYHSLLQLFTTPER